MNRMRSLLVGVIAFLVIAGVLLFVSWPGSDRALPSIAIGGPYTLQKSDGTTATEKTYRDKWQLVYFGYTLCPDACPTALNDISIALSELGPKRDAVRPVFITVDPERDTPESLKAYVTSFDAPILALTGTADQVAKAAKGYRVYYAKHPEAGGDYSMDHSSVIYVMDPEGRFTASFTHESTPEQISERLKKLIG